MGRYSDPWECNADLSDPEVVVCIVKFQQLLPAALALATKVAKDPVNASDSDKLINIANYFDNVDAKAVMSSRVHPSELGEPDVQDFLRGLAMRLELQGL